MTEPVPEFSEAEVKAMTPEQIVAANRAGQLDELLGIKSAKPIPSEREVAHGGITPDDLATMTPDQIVQARREGRLEHLGYAGDRR